MLFPRAIYGVIIAAIIGAFGIWFYNFHYKPLNDLEHQVKYQSRIIKECHFTRDNLKQTLKKAQADIETQKMNTELCYAEAEAYKDNETIKDTADEGYFTF